MASFSKVFLDFQQSPQTTGLSNIKSYILREMRRDDPTAGFTDAQIRRIEEYVKQTGVTQKDIDAQFAGTLPGQAGRDMFSGLIHDYNLPGMLPGELALNVSQSTPGDQMARAGATTRGATTGGGDGGSGTQQSSYRVPEDTGTSTPTGRQAGVTTYQAPRVDVPVAPGSGGIPIPGVAHGAGALADPTFEPYNVYSRMRALATPYHTNLGTLGDYQTALARGYQPAMGRWMLDPSLQGTGSFAEFLSQPDYVPDTGGLRQGFTNIANLLSGRPAQEGSFAQYSKFFDPDIAGRENVQKNLVNAALAASGTPSYFNQAVQSALGRRMNVFGQTDPTQSGINAARAFADWYSGQTGLGGGLPQPALSQTAGDRYNYAGNPAFTQGDARFNYVNPLSEEKVQEISAGFPATSANLSEVMTGLNKSNPQAVPAYQYWNTLGDPAAWEEVRQRSRV